MTLLFDSEERSQGVGIILPRLLRLAVPNVVALTATVAVAIAETIYVGHLGISALAAMAIAFPIVMLQQALSAGAMGGGVASAISRALGASDVARANALAIHGLLIALILGSLSTMFIFVFAKDICTLMGARGEALTQAERYLCVLFAGAVPIWLANILISIVRGTGNMRLSSRAVLGISAIQMPIGAALGLGLGPIPQLGMAGVALGQVIAFSAGALAMAAHLLSPKKTRLQLHWQQVSLDRLLLHDILRVGAVSCIGPLQTNLTVIVTTSMIATFGANALGGYGIGARLEMLLVNIAFGVGVASIPLVGLAIGGGQSDVAKRIAWVTGLTGAMGLGAIGLLMAMQPQIWSSLFTNDPNVLRYANEYLRYSGPAYGFFGLGLCLFFASQGSGHVVGTVLAGTLRLGVVLGSCWFLSSTSATAADFFLMVAAGMVCYGLASALAVKTSRWVSPVVTQGHAIQRQKF